MFCTQFWTGDFDTVDFQGKQLKVASIGLGLIGFTRTKNGMKSRITAIPAANHIRFKQPCLAQSLSPVVVGAQVVTVMRIRD